MSEIQEPRDQAATMASDWEWLKRTIMMIHDRALTGTPLCIERPTCVPQHWDVIDLNRRSMHRMIDDIFSTAVLVEPEKSDVNES